MRSFLYMFVPVIATLLILCPAATTCEPCVGAGCFNHSRKGMTGQSDVIKRLDRKVVPDDECERECGVKTAGDDVVKCSFDSEYGAICMCVGTNAVFVSKEEKCKVPDEECSILCGVPADREDGEVRCTFDKSSGAQCSCQETDAEFVSKDEGCIVPDTECKKTCGVPANEYGDVLCRFDVKTGAQCSCKEPDGVFFPEIKDCKSPNEECKEVCGEMVGVWCKFEANKGAQCSCNEDQAKFVSKERGCQNPIEKCTEICGITDGVTCIFEENEGALCACEIEGAKFVSKERGCQTQCNDISECKNGGKCTEISIGKFCFCLKGTEGHFCEKVPACQTLHCGTDAECRYNITEGSVKCACKDEELTFDNDDIKCKAQCNNNSDCNNGGKCIKTKYGWLCSCLEGTEGRFCEQVPACKTLQCGTDAECKYLITEKSAKCICKDQKLTFDRDDKKCRAPCYDDTDCMNGGKCNSHTRGNFCSCLEGTEGHYCRDVPACKFLSCGTDALCSYDVTEQSAKCKCDDPNLTFIEKSKKCVKGADQCANHVCENAGTCIVYNDGPKCLCKSSFSGDRCEIGGRDEIKRLYLLIWILCSTVIVSILVISCLTVSRCRKDGGMKNGIC